MRNSTEQKHRLSSELRQALSKGEFELWYQPQVCLTSNALCGVEALLRWRHPNLGLLTLESFIGVLEESVIAEEVGTWILQEACSAARHWAEAGLGALRIGINLFAAQLRCGKLFSVVSQIVQGSGIDLRQLELEITEITVLRNSDHSIKELRRLNSLGVNIAFDDFGTGFASLSLLQKYPLSRLKLIAALYNQLIKILVVQPSLKRLPKWLIAWDLRLSQKASKLPSKKRF